MWGALLKKLKSGMGSSSGGGGGKGSSTPVMAVSDFTKQAPPPLPVTSPRPQQAQSPLLPPVGAPSLPQMFAPPMPQQPTPMQAGLLADYGNAIVEQKRQAVEDKISGYRGLLSGGIG